MNYKDFDTLVDNTIKEEIRILKTKGPEYTRGSTDRLANFKTIAELLPRDIADPKITWLVYFMKHVDAIISYIREGKELSEETIMSRIHDSRNYLLLLAGLIKDQGKEDGRD